MQVDFMIIGAQKSGTTSLAYHLAQHPALSIAAEREPHFFSKRADWQAALPRYHALFAPDGGKLCFEASTSYSFLPEFPETAARLAAYNPDLKLIYLVRDPVARIASHYLHRLRKGKVFRRPEAEVRAKPIYFDRSRYATQLRPYRERFPREQIHVLVYEDYAVRPRTALTELAGFLGIDESGFAEVDTVANHVTRAHAFRGEREIRGALSRVPGLGGLADGRTLFDRFADRVHFPESLRSEIWRRLEPEVAELESVIGRPLTAWRRKRRAAAAVSSPA